MVCAPSLIVLVARMVPAPSEPDFTIVWESTSVSSSFWQQKTVRHSTNLSVLSVYVTDFLSVYIQSCRPPPPALSAAPAASLLSSPWLLLSGLSGLRLAWPGWWMGAECPQEQNKKGCIWHLFICECRFNFILSPTCRSCVAVALCSGFLTKHFLTKSVNSSDQSSGFLNVGGGLVGIIKIACWSTVSLWGAIKVTLIQTLYHPSLAHYTYSHGMYVSIGRFALCHLYGCDAQGPDISDTIVSNLLDHLWGHPERSTNHSVSFCHSVL